MTDVPHEVLSEHFQERIAGRRLLAAVFTTFELEPEFFELQILPVFVDTPVSHVDRIRRIQLEAALRPLSGKLAVYYDSNGLRGAGGSAGLDIARIPIRLATGIFHPKNVFVMLESKDLDEHGHRSRSLLVAAMSANLTKSGWWRNVEICHIEEVAEGEATRMRGDLLEACSTLRRISPNGTDHGALDEIAAFVRGTSQHSTRSSNGWLHPHFSAGTAPLDEVLAAVVGDIKDLNLEVIAPYFDRAATSAPLDKLIRRFKPSEIRVLLPRNDQGEATVTPEMHAWLAEHPDAGWGRLPKIFERAGKSTSAEPRFVHAKVYRLFSRKPKREILCVGSHNLTRAAHQAGGNLESCLIVEVDPPRTPEFWLEPEGTRPSAFAPIDAPESEAGVAERGSRLALRYNWKRHAAEAYWDASKGSGDLTIDANGEALFTISPLAPKAWTPLATAAADALCRILPSTSFVWVSGDRPERTVLMVQEEEMWRRPSALQRLSIHEILEFWASLTAAQRSELIETRMGELLGDQAASELVTRIEPLALRDSPFDRFAGIFHAFAALETSVENSLKADNPRDAAYRLFGTTYDSLGTLLERLSHANPDPVLPYVIALCAKQTCASLRRAHPDFFADHKAEADGLSQALAIVERSRAGLLVEQPPETAEFLAWFEKWFLAPAKRRDEVSA